MEKTKYILDEQRLDWLTSETNRSNAQTQFLFGLVDGDWGMMLDLEYRLKNNFIGYCPGDRDSVDNVLSMELRNDWFQFTGMSEYVRRFKNEINLKYDVKQLKEELESVNGLNLGLIKEIRELKKKFQSDIKELREELELVNEE